MTPRISVILPAYNASAFILRSVRSVEEFLSARGISYEIIIVDDGSTDSTPTLIQTSTTIHFLRLEKNMGKGAAVREGFRKSTGEIVAFTDADLPYGPEPLALALYYIEKQHFHAVIGDRSLPSTTQIAQPSLIRSLLSSFCSFIVRTLLIGGVPDTQCGMKVFRGDVARELSRLTRIDRFAMDIEILYLLFRYHLDVKQFPVVLIHNDRSTVRIFRDSLIAAFDIFKMRLFWSLRKYESVEAKRIYRESHEQDILRSRS